MGPRYPEYLFPPIEWYGSRGGAATRIALPNEIALRHLERRALAVLRGGCGSDEAEPGALFIPPDGRAGIDHQLVGIEFRGLFATLPGGLGPLCIGPAVP